MKPLNLIGNRYGMLLVKEKIINDKPNTFFKCVCDCGNEKIIQGTELNRGHYKSCGCNRTPRTTYEYRNHPLYDVWKGMKSRCYNKNNSSYPRYGQRGVKVCNSWKKDFISFYMWALKSGYKDGLQIDKDIIGDGKLYSPTTCKWVTPTENNRHRTSNKINKESALEIRISLLSNKDLAKKYNLHPSSIGKIKSNKKWKM